MGVPQEFSSQSSTFGPHPVAIVGIGCRFPSIEGVDELWSALLGRRDVVGTVPEDRFDIDSLFDARSGVPGKINTKHGGFLSGVDEFDPAFFGIAPREAVSMDPQQRLVLEVTWQALEDAALLPAELRGSRTGVFLGAIYGDYEDLHLGDLRAFDVYANTGGARSLISGRVSFAFGFEGPSLSIDTACSSSLVAVHLACQSLGAGESKLAVAGGVNLILQPQFSVGFARSGMLAPDGHCKFGDAAADGFVRSEGAAVVVLKTLADALEQEDRIYAVIRGSAVNNDGRSGGMLLTPSQRGQEEAARASCADAKVEPSSVAFVEAHGTGTKAGDPVEIHALGEVFGNGRPDASPLLTGSIKTNIGHTEGAAGCAGLIKAALSLDARLLPSSLHVAEKNPEIDWAGARVAMATDPVSLAHYEPLLAGVSSFGISGTNAHAILQASPATSEQVAPSRGHELVCLSGHTAEVLRRSARRWVEWLDDFGDGDRPSLYDVAWTANLRRTHDAYRVGLSVRNLAELRDRLADIAGESDSTDIATSRRATADAAAKRVVFVYSGQGSQWLGMGRQLSEAEPVFRAHLEQCEQLIRKETGWSLIEELSATSDASRLDRVDVVQPCIFAMQVCLTALWKSWGVMPDAVVGHSLGEIAAAHTAGALSLEDATRVICRRSRLVRERRGGGMMVAHVSGEDAEGMLSGRDTRMSVAAINSPETVIFSGEIEALREVGAELKAREVFCREIKVDYASHCAQMDELLPRLREALHGIAPKPGDVTIASTVEGELTTGAEFGAEYWARNLREPVRFWPAVARLLEAGAECFIEVNPHPVLGPSIREGVADRDRKPVVIGSLRREQNERGSMLSEAAILYERGLLDDLRPLYAWRPALPVRLPPQVWERERLWRESTPVAARAGGVYGGEHPLLTACLPSATRSKRILFTAEIEPRRHAYFADHRVGDGAVLPATAYIELAHAAIARTSLPGQRLGDFRFDRPLLIDDRKRLLQLELEPEVEGLSRLVFASRLAGESEWAIHGSAMVRGEGSADDEPGAPLPIAEIVARCGGERSADEHYAGMSGVGIDYGPCFRGVEALWVSGREACGRIGEPDGIRADASGYLFHPARLDACLQIAAALIGYEDDGAPLLPVAIESACIWRRPQSDSLFAHATHCAGGESDGDQLVDLRVADSDGDVVAEFRGVRLRKMVDNEASARSLLFDLSWVESPAEPNVKTSESRAGWILVGAEREGESRLAKAIEAAGQRCHFGADDSSEGWGGRWANVWARCSKDAVSAVVFDARSEPDDIVRGERDILSGALRVTQALASLDVEVPPRLIFLTCAGQRVLEEPEFSLEQSTLWGFGRAVDAEHPELLCKRIDSSPSADSAEVADLLVAELAGAARDSEVAFRNGKRYVRRLERLGSERLDAATEDRAPSAASRRAPDSYRVEIDEVGILDKLSVRASDRPAPGFGRVEVEVEAAGLNFRDVMLAMGMLPAPGRIDLGWECAGRVSALGPGVDGVRVGDSVLAVAFNSFSRHCVVDVQSLAPIPEGMSVSEAVTIPGAFLTAHYSLVTMGRIAEGERVLIHSAAGGVGLAAVQICLLNGCEVFATAGSEAKRSYLRSLGIEHVFNSRRLDFASEVLDVTGGEGVDVVLNSLAGEAIPASLRILRSFGRFLELGKRDVVLDSRIGMSALRKNISFHVIDLDPMIREHPERVGSELREFLSLFESGSLEPLPYRSFPIENVAEAFRFMARGQHLGKIIVTLRDPADLEIRPLSRDGPDVDPDRSVLVTGGLGGLGLSIADWLSDQGARHLVLMGRRAPDSEASARIAELERRGVEVQAVQADVSDYDAMSSALEKAAKQTPIGAIIHAAGVLADATIANLTSDQLVQVSGPKVAGSWNLHRWSLDRELDFFVLFSSAATLLGSPGQANYCAANAFMDSLAALRTSRGLPGLSVAWGTVSDVGLAAAESNRGERLERHGLRAISPSDVNEALGLLMGLPLSHVGVMRLDVHKWTEANAGSARSGLFASLLEGDTREGDAGSGAREELMQIDDPTERLTRLATVVREQVGKVLRISPSRIDSQVPLGDIGLDSLMSVELRNRLESRFALALPATTLFNHPTVSDLVPYLASEMSLGIEEAAHGSEPIDTVLARMSHQAPTAAADSTGSSRPSPSGHLDVATATPSSSSSPRAANLQHFRRPRDGSR